jgi:outer membrane protein assembly factor BamA
MIGGLFALLLLVTTTGWSTSMAEDTGESMSRAESDSGAPSPPAEPKAATGGWRATPLPVLFSTPETGFGAGAGLLLTHRGKNAPPEARPQTISAIGFYTAKNQTSIALVPELYFQSERWHLQLTIGYMKFPRSFHGIGPDTPETSKEDYTIEGGSLEGSLARGIYRSLRAGLQLNLEGGGYPETEEGGLLDLGMIAGHDGGFYSGLGPIIVWDSRDNVFYPSRGNLLSLGTRFFADRLGSDLDYTIHELDLRHYRSLAPSHILAVQAFATTRTGDVPLLDLAPIGGMLRGIHEDRFLDRAMAMAQVEYRFPIRGLFSGVAFAGAGDVSDGLERYRIGDAKAAGGFGLRFAVDADEKVNLRFDLGISDYGSEVYFQFNEAF